MEQQRPKEGGAAKVALSSWQLKLAGPAEWPAPEPHRGAQVAEVGKSDGRLLRNGAKAPYCL